jgi:hypothetical protein
LALLGVTQYLRAEGDPTSQEEAPEQRAATGINIFRCILDRIPQATCERVALLQEQFSAVESDPKEEGQLDLAKLKINYQTQPDTEPH